MHLATKELSFMVAYEVEALQPTNLVAHLSMMNVATLASPLNDLANLQF